MRLFAIWKVNGCLVELPSLSYNSLNFLIVLGSMRLSQLQHSSLVCHTESFTRTAVHCQYHALVSYY